MMEKWLPASLRSSDNPFYENLILETEREFNDFVDTKIRTIKDIYSISNASVEDLMSIGENLYLLDKNVLNGVYEFLKNQSSINTSNNMQEITEAVALFFQLEFEYFSVIVTDPGGHEYEQTGVHMVSPKPSDFTGGRYGDTCQLFDEMIRAHVPGVSISYGFNGSSSDEFWFLYPIGATPEMEATLLQSLKNVICDYALTYNDGFEDMLAEDPVENGWVSSIVRNDNSCQILAPNSSATELESLGEIIKFHVEYSEFNIDNTTHILYVEWMSDDESAAAKFRNEIGKIPQSIASRGTGVFYKSLFNTLGFNFPGVFSLMKTVDNNRTGRLIDNIHIDKHGVEASGTSIVSIPVDESFTAQEVITNTLDEEVERTLDSDGIYNKLDMVSQSEETLYKKDVLLGFQLDKKQFSGSSILPSEFSKFVQELAALNQKTTDVLHTTAIISLDIDKNDMNESIMVPDIEPFMQVTSSDIEYDSIKENEGLRLKLNAYEKSGNSWVKFYDYYLNKDTDISWKPEFVANDKCLTTKATIQGKKHRVSNVIGTVESANEITVALPNWANGFATKNMVVKLFAEGDEESGYFLFKEDASGRFIQVAGPTDSSGEFLYDISVNVNNDVFSFISEDAFAALDVTYKMTLMSDKTEVKVGKVSLSAEWTEYGEPAQDSPVDLWTIEFKDNDGNPFEIDLPLNIDLMLLVSRHETE